MVFLSYTQRTRYWRPTYMPSCERISPQDFHNRESRAYTEQCVRQLMNGRMFQDYVSHVEYSEWMYLTWLIAPIGLVIAFYYHLLFLQGNGDSWVGSSGEGIGDRAPFMSFATVLLIFFLGPCIAIAPFVGFHEPSTRRYVLGVVILLTGINLALVSFGGSALNHPPYLKTFPPLPWFSAKVSELPGLAAEALVRALPLEGPAMAGWLVFKWREARWRRSWHVPLPILTVPIVVGAFSCLWFLVTSRAIFFILNDDGGRVGLVADVSAFLGMLKADAMKLFGSGMFPFLFTDPLLLYHTWWTAMILSSVYFLAILFHPFIRFVLDLIYGVLPTHPTTWGLAIVSCVGGAIALMQYENAEAGPLLAVFALFFLLLHNGCVIE